MVCLTVMWGIPFFVYILGGWKELFNFATTYY